MRGEKRKEVGESRRRTERWRGEKEVGRRRGRKDGEGGRWGRERGRGWFECDICSLAHIHGSIFIADILPNPQVLGSLSCL